MLDIDTELLTKYIIPEKQSAKRHYGVHPYFTRRPWNVVNAYIKKYSPDNGIVLDPFGGSGVTVVEASVLGRHGIQIDINPLGNFIANQLLIPAVDIQNLEKIGIALITKAKQILMEQGLDKILEDYWHPIGIKLPKDSDVEYVEDLFSDQQTAELAVLKKLIDDVEQKDFRNLLLLTFSATISKTNKTFISAKNRKASRGGATILSIYRYHVPQVPVELFPIEQFALRFKKILLAKKETNLVLKGDGAVYLESATNMTSIKDTSIDYIFTDPPYGSFIKYIKLSTMWNSWLGFTVPEDLAQKEVIAQNNNDQQYFELLKQSAKECYRVLKEGSYLSLVFSHRDLSYWRKIYNIFADAGFNYKISVPQPLKTVWSLHKKQNDLSSFAGEVIITFKKEALSNNRKTQSLKDIIDNLFSFDETLPTDELCLNLIPKLYESGILDEIGNKKIILSDFLKGHLIYNAEQKSWQKTH